MSFTNFLKEKIYRFWYGRKGDKDWQAIMNTLGNPGVWYYVKKEYYKDALAYIKNEECFHDLNKTGNKILELSFKDFEYKDEISNCDFSQEKFSDTDIVISIWKVTIKKN